MPTGAQRHCPSPSSLSVRPWLPSAAYPGAHLLPPRPARPFPAGRAWPAAAHRPVWRRFFFRSGNIEHPEDKLFNTSVEVLPFDVSVNAVGVP